MARFGMVIDTAKCVGCMDCAVACKTENNVPDGFCRDWIVTEVKGTYPQLLMEIRSERCNMCNNPPCVYCCPTGASHVEDFGKLVQIDKDMCIGCKACLAARPYGACSGLAMATRLIAGSSRSSRRVAVTPDSRLMANTMWP